MTAEPERASSRARRRAVGCLSVLFMIAAVPGIVVGVLVLLASRESAQSHDGTAGALAGLGEIVGIGVTAASVIVFVVGAIFYVRSAADADARE